MENGFCISGRTKYPKDSMSVIVDTSICGRILVMSDTIFKDVSPDKF